MLGGVLSRFALARDIIGVNKTPQSNIVVYMCVGGWASVPGDVLSRFLLTVWHATLLC